MENISKKKKTLCTLRTGAPIEDICGTRFVHNLLLCVDLCDGVYNFQVDFLFPSQTKMFFWVHILRLKTRALDVILKNVHCYQFFLLFVCLVDLMWWMRTMYFHQEYDLAVHIFTGWNRKQSTITAEHSDAKEFWEKKN